MVEQIGAFRGRRRSWRSVERRVKGTVEVTDCSFELPEFEELVGAALEAPLNGNGDGPIFDCAGQQEISGAIDRLHSIDIVVAAVRQGVGEDFGPVNG
jgi:hypothetical protein